MLQEHKKWVCLGSPICGFWEGDRSGQYRAGELVRLEAVEKRLPEVIRSVMVWEMAAWCVFVGSWARGGYEGVSINWCLTSAR